MTRKRIEPHLYRDEDSGVYYAREQYQGKRGWVSLRTKSITLARIRLKPVLKGDPFVQVRPPSASGKTFADAFAVVKEIQAAKARRTSEQTDYIVDKHLAPVLRELCPYLSNFERTASEVWAQYIRRQGELTPGRSLQYDRRFLVMALLRAHERGWVKRRFSKTDFHLTEAREAVGRALEPEEVTRLLQAVSDLRNHKLWLQMLLALKMGMRKSEILNLEVSEIDLKSGLIRIPPSKIKTRQPRQHPIPIHRDVAFRLGAMVNAAKGRFLFPQVDRSKPGRPEYPDRPQTDLDRSWDRVKGRARVKCRFHDLRHTAITGMIADGIAPGTVSQVTGASIQVVMKVYAHLAGDVAKRVRNWGSGI